MEVIHQGYHSILAHDFNNQKYRFQCLGIVTIVQQKDHNNKKNNNNNNTNNIIDDVNNKAVEICLIEVMGSPSLDFS